MNVINQDSSKISVFKNTRVLLLKPRWVFISRIWHFKGIWSLKNGPGGGSPPQLHQPWPINQTDKLKKDLWLEHSLSIPLYPFFKVPFHHSTYIHVCIHVSVCGWVCACICWLLKTRITRGVKCRIWAKKKKMTEHCSSNTVIGWFPSCFVREEQRV